MFHHIDDVAGIGHADLFPHLRRGGCNTGDILKTACGQTFHELVLIVGILYEVYQAGSDQVRQMADGSHDPVMLMIIQNDGDGTDGSGNFNQPVGIFLLCLCGRCHNIVGIFKKMIGRVFITGLFRTCHRVSAHEKFLHAKRGNDTVDIFLGGTDIGDQGTRL